MSAAARRWNGRAVFLVLDPRLSGLDRFWLMADG
jgi:hypothetical protein